MRTSENVRSLVHGLECWAPGDPPATTWLLPELRSLLQAEFAGAYRPRVKEQGWALDFMHADGANATGLRSTFTSYVEALPPSDTFLGQGNPHLVPFDQRNRVMTAAQLTTADSGAPYAALFGALGILGHDQVRVLVCDGPQALSWIGATRELPFQEREVAILRRLTRPLVRRLRLERYNHSAPPMAAVVETLLEAVGAPAFVLGPAWDFEFVNPAGLTLLQQDREEVLRSIQGSIASADADMADYAITQVRAPGWPAYVLAVRNTPARIRNRVFAVQGPWGLSTRHARVLELVAEGLSNKEIAGQLACAEVTVENHVTELFRKSGARSRAGLVGRLVQGRGTHD